MSDRCEQTEVFRAARIIRNRAFQMHIYPQVCALEVVTRNSLRVSLNLTTPEKGRPVSHEELHRAGRHTDKREHALDMDGWPSHISDPIYEGNEDYWDPGEVEITISEPGGSKGTTFSWSTLRRLQSLTSPDTIIAVIEIYACSLWGYRKLHDDPLRGSDSDLNDAARTSHDGVES